MNQQEIINSNVKIAEFMGKEAHEKLCYQEFGNIDYSNCHGFYNSSWNWLMPVVEKISLIPLLNHDNTPCTEPSDTCHPYTFNMADEDGNRMVRLKGFQLQKAKTLMEATFLAVVDFVYFHQTTLTNTK
jgi:hypothetical protein